MAAKPWDKVWAEMSAKVRYLWHQGCRPSTALLGLASLAHVREESISGNYSGIKSATRNPVTKASIVNDTKNPQATSPTPGKAEPERSTTGEAGLAIAARRLLAARTRRTSPALVSHATEVDIPSPTG